MAIRTREAAAILAACQSVDTDTSLDRSNQLRRVVADTVLEDSRDFANDARVAREISVEHDEIGELATLDRADLVVHTEDLGAVGRHDLNRLRWRETRLDEQLVVALIAESG